MAKNVFGHIDEYQFGPRGFDIITASSASTTGLWYSIEPTSGSVVISGTTAQNCTNLSGQTIDHTVFGRFTSVQINSGTLIAYKLE